jgi:hypothetical protein
MRRSGLLISIAYGVVDARLSVEDPDPAYIGLANIAAR